jgi:hypothetical protein
LAAALSVKRMGLGISGGKFSATALMEYSEKLNRLNTTAIQSRTLSVVICR